MIAVLILYVYDATEKMIKFRKFKFCQKYLLIEGSLNPNKVVYSY